MPEPHRGPADPQEASRRRFVRRQWARRWLAWRPALVVLLLVGLVAAGVWLVLFSSWLAIQRVEVHGTRLLADGEVRRAARVEEGRPLARADLEAVRARVESLPEVRAADVSRAWPDAVLVRVTEREAVAVVEVDGRLRGMDETGVVFRDFATAPPHLPRIRVAADTRSEAMAEGARIVGMLPSGIARRVAHVELRTIDQITLQLRDGRSVTWGSAEQSADKARVLSVLLERPAREYDVTVPGRPTTRG